MATFSGIPLLTALKWGKDQVAAGWIKTIIQGQPMLEELPQLKVNGRVYIQEHEDTLPSGGFRSVNETYTPSYGENDETYWGTTILGGEVKIDIAELNSPLADGAQLRKDQYAKHAKTASMRHSWETINGPSAKGFKGLARLVNDGYGTLHDPGSDGPLSFDELDEAILNFENGDPDVMLMNKELVMRFSHRARSGYTQFTLVDAGTDRLGRPVKRYNGIPLRILRRGINGSNAVAQIFPFTESSAALTGGSTSSIYIARYGSEAVTGLLGNGGAMHMRTLQESTEGPYEIGRMEFYPGVASFDPYGLVRYMRITNA